ncbi:Calx-beta domain-containing protein [Limibacter armeniacum]|uniref:Calx-beta domain-containing protein n=1 Tax=Limibacter armeniacum TaxID=466084 RepID=UPI002FE67C58
MKKYIKAILGLLLSITLSSLSLASTPTSYQLVADDYTLVGDGQYSNFEIYNELGTFWVAKKIAYILEEHFPDATDGESTTVTYAYYNGSRSDATMDFVHADGKWTTKENIQQTPISDQEVDFNTTLDIVTWNVEWLGAPEKKSGTSLFWQFEATAEQILRMDADIYALQEVVVDEIKGDNLQKLVDLLNEKEGEEKWAGFHNPRHSQDWKAVDEDFPAQKTAFVYKKSVVTFKESFPMFNDQYTSNTDYSLPDYSGSASSFMASGRLPLLFKADVTVNGITQEITFINIHFKCCSDAASRRQADGEYLINKLREQYADNNLVILGDYNNASYEGKEGPTRWGWYNSKDFTYACGEGIDHMTLSDELFDELTALETPYYTEYELGNISDHNPQMLRLLFSETSNDIGFFDISEDKVYEAAETAITLSVSSLNPVSADQVFTVEISGNKLEESDYELEATTITLEAGTSEASTTLTFIQDQQIESVEQVTVTLVPQGNMKLMDGYAEYTITIIDSPVLSLSADKVEVTETDNSITLTIRTNVPVSGEQTVNLTATSSFGSDNGFLLTDTSLSFSDGGSQATTTLQILDDEVEDGTETITITLSEASEGLVIGENSTLDITVTDDDEPTVTALNDEPIRQYYSFLTRSGKIYLLSHLNNTHTVGVSAYTTDGTEISTQQLQVEKNVPQLLDTNQFPSGIYIWKFVTPEGTFTRKLGVE